MGFDNECILNIQSLPGEYFCPVCRTLVYPNEAMQTQCTHLYCKPCLAYIVATTCACPYDGYLVSEADAKPLIELNKLTAEAIEKIQVHCLYHRSGCQWQGTLSECITHCTTCNFGNSPVVCNRCGTQIVHRQVQEHAQICPGVQPQAQQADNTQSQPSAAQNQAVAQPVAAVSQEPSSQAAVQTSAAAAAAPAPVASSSAPASSATVPASTGPDHGQPTVAVQPQVATMQAPTNDQWYQQQQLQYQQYYQQYSGYDPYQQHYQQYGYYQQQVHPQYPQAYVQSHPVQVQQQPQMYVQQQPQTHPQAQAPALPQPQVQPHSHPQAVPHSQLPQMQAPTNPQQPLHAHLQQPQMHPSGQTQAPGQPLGQPQTQPPQLQPQPLPQAQPPHLQPQLRPQHQQPMVSQHLPPQLQQQQPLPQYQPQSNVHVLSQPPVQQPPLHMQPQTHPRPHSLPQPQLQPQPQPQPHPQLQPQPQPHPLPQPQFQPHPQGQPQPHPQPQLNPAPAHAVTGHQSFPQPHLHQQTPPSAATHQRPMHMHPLQQGASQPPLQHPTLMQTQFHHQQPPQAQMRPPVQAPVQGQQQAAVPSMQGPHVQLPHAQQQAHHLVRPSTQQIHHPSGMQAPQHPSIPQPQTQGQPHHNQLHHQASFPLQQQVQPQQSLRPQGPPFMQQPQLQPMSQTMARPLALSSTMLQQPFTQPPGGPGIWPNVPSEPKVGSVQLPHTGSQGSGLPSSPTSLKASVDDRQGDSVSDKTGHITVEVMADKTDEVPADNLNKQKSENNLKCEGNEEKFSDKAEENIQSVANGESSAPYQKDDVSECKPIAKEEASGVSEPTPGRGLGDSSVERNDDQGDNAEETKEIERKSDGFDDKSVHGLAQAEDSAKLQMHHNAMRNMKPVGTADKAAPNYVPQGSTCANDRGNMQGPPRQPAHIGAPPAHDLSAPPAHDRAFQPGYPDRNIPQFPPQGPVPGDPRGFPPAQMHSKVPGLPVHHTSMLDHERYTQQPLPHGPQYMQENASQRAPAPDQMLTQHMPPHLGSNQERMFQEPPRAMQGPGQPFAPNQMRLSHQFPENLAHQGLPSVVSDPLQVSMVKQPPGGFPGPGSHASLGRGPASFGPSQGSHPPGQGQFMPASAGAAGPRMEPFAGVPMSGPPTGSLDTAAGMNARGPPIHLEGQPGHSHPGNPFEADVYANKRPRPFDGRQPEHHQSMAMPSEHFPRGMQPGNQSNMMMMNGLPGKIPESSLFHGPEGERFKPFPEERYKSLAEEGFKAPADDRFKPYGLDPGRRIVERRDFEEDLKQFPRPSDLDAEAGIKFDGYLSSSRLPLDRNSHPLGLDAASRLFDRPMQGFGPEGAPRVGGTSPVPSRLLSINPSSSHVPIGSSGSSLHPMDNIERQRPLGLRDDNLGRKGDPAHPDFNRSASDFGRLRTESLFALRSPGREITGIPPSRFGSMSVGHGPGSQARLEDFNSREPHAFSDGSKQHNLPPDSIGSALHESKIPPISSGPGIMPSHFRRVEADILQMGERSANVSGHMRGGELDGHDILPNHIRGGDPLGGGGPGNFHSHLRLGELSGMETVPPHMRSRDFPRFGEPGLSNSFPRHGFPDEHGGFNSGPFQGALDPLEHPRKRKAGSMGWCRICKIDCETVEGLDLHSQTKEHQKMAMDIVLTIKQDNAKKHKLSSEEHQVVNKSRKAAFDGRPSRR